ncbi:hypothetical protein QWJ07_00005, partial [Frankia sp. RB7]|nr:hypothetical protein [Frankia sp. RB7]
DTWLAAWPKPPRPAPRQPDTRRRDAPNRWHHPQTPNADTQNQIARRAFSATAHRRLRKILPSLVAQQLAV